MAHSVVRDIAVTDLVEQVALAIPNHIRMPFENAHVSLVEATSDALRRLQQEDTLPTALIDFRPRRSRHLIRQKIKELALNGNDNDHRPLPTKAPSSPRKPLRVENQPSRTPQRATKSIQEAVRRLALADRTNRDPYITVHAELAEKYLPRLDIMLSVRGIDDEEANTQYLGSVTAFVDTGAHITCISADLLPSEYWKYLQTDTENAPYRVDDGQRVFTQIDFMIDLPQMRDFTFNGLARVVPRHAMPNALSGVLLGQNTFLDRMEFSLRPWRVTQALYGGGFLDVTAEKPPGQGWGTIDIKRWVDLDGKMIDFDRRA